MQITVENAGGCKRIIRAEIPADVVSEKLSEGFREINRQVSFPGFRKGKAPRQLLEQRFGADVLNDVRQSLADEALREAVESKAMKILGQPRLTGDVPLKAGSPATLTLEAEVYPEFELPEYKGVEIDRPAPKVAEREIYARQRSEQMRSGKLEPVATAAAKGHLLRANVRVTSGETVVFRQNGGLLEVGYPWIAGLAAAAGTLVGLKAADTKQIKAALPDDFGNEQYRGKDCVIDIEVVEVLQYEGPGLEEFAKSSGKESLAAWNEETKAALLSEKETSIDRLVEERVIRKVVDATSMELPERFSAKRADELVQQEAYRMYQQGANDEEVRGFLSDNKDKGIDDVRNGLKRAFIVDSIARKERVIVTEDEINREVGRIAAAFGRSVEEVHADLTRRGTLSGMREEMKVSKVLSLLRQKAKYK